MAAQKKNPDTKKAKNEIVTSKKSRRKRAPKSESRPQQIPQVIEKASAKAKAKATEAGQPYIQVLGVELDPTNPTFGAFSMDWNDIFIQGLRSMGYKGQTDEIIIDQWFKTVCYHVMKDTYESYEAMKPGNGRRTQTRMLGQNLSEIS